MKAASLLLCILLGGCRLPTAAPVSLELQAVTEPAPQLYNWRARIHDGEMVVTANIGVSEMPHPDTGRGWEMAVDDQDEYGRGGPDFIVTADGVIRTTNYTNEVIGHADVRVTGRLLRVAFPFATQQAKVYVSYAGGYAYFFADRGPVTSLFLDPGITEPLKPGRKP